MADDDERKRRQRERKQLERERILRGEMVVQVVVRRTVRDVLTACRWIGEWDEDNKAVVQEAVQILVDGIQPVTRDTSS